jgi:hypothetical protein
MSTEINIVIGGSDLRQRATEQTNANRFAKIESDSQKKALAKGRAERSKEQAKKGEDEAGKPTSSPMAPAKLRKDDPAANRLATETVSRAWFVVTGNDWRINTATTFNGITYATSPTVLGTNQGRSIYVCSTDGTYWLSQENITELASTVAPGSATSKAFTNFDSGRFDHAYDIYQFEVFPSGGGAFVLSFRFQQAYAYAWWESTPQGYTLQVNQLSGIKTGYKSYLVSTSAVKEISTPQGVKDYFAGYFPGLVDIQQWLVQGGAGGLIYKPTGATNEAGPADSYGQVGFNQNLTMPFRTGWWQRAMPSAPLGGIGYDSFWGGGAFGSPAVYERAMNTGEYWTATVPTYDSNGVPNNQAQSWSSWSNLVYANGVARMKTKPIAAYSPNWQASVYQYPMSSDVKIYKAVSATPSQVNWDTYIAPAQKVNPETPGQTFWTRLKTLTFAANAAPLPNSSLPAKYVFTTDWGSPGYCKAQLASLGFISADLTP